MVNAFVLVKSDAGTSSRLVEDIAAIGVVDEAHVVAGDWDLILEVSAPEIYDILSTIADSIQPLSGVLDTKTYVSLED